MTAIEKLAKALGCTAPDLEVALDRANLALVWDPDEYMPDHLMAVYRTAVTNKDKERSFWWTLKPVVKGKYTNRNGGEVHKWT